MTIPLLFAVIAGVVGSFQLGETTHSRARTSPPRENVVFYYQNVHPEDTSKFKGAYAVVTAGQGGETARQRARAEREAASLIKSTGAKALRYVNFYWYPQGRRYQELNISNHKGWIFCGKDRRKIVGRKVGNEKWFFLDANERGARKAIRDYLRKIKRYGYDGVFFDRGASSFLGANDGGNYISWKRSTCTRNKVIGSKRRTFSDVFASVLKDARKRIFDGRGNRIFLNFGKAPYTKPKLRPNPADKDCRERRWDRCSWLRDVWKSVNQVVDEAPSHAGSKYFLEDYRDNLSSQRHYADVLGEIKVTTKNNRRFRKQVFYQWAQARLFRLNLFVNTGDDECPNSDDICWRMGTAPYLTKVRLGAPIDRLPRKMACDSGIKCLWLRRYKHGMVVVNVSSRRKTLTQRLGVSGDGGKRLVRNLYNSSQVGDSCIRKIANRRIPAKSGRVYLYRRSESCH